MFQRIDRCNTQVSTQLLFQHGEKVSITLWAYGGMIAKLTGKFLLEEVTVRDLVLYSPSLESIKFDNCSVLMLLYSTRIRAIT